MAALPARETLGLALRRLAFGSLGDGFAYLLVALPGAPPLDGVRAGRRIRVFLSDRERFPTSIDGDAQWLRDRRERLAADAPLKVRLPIWLLFVAAGLLVERLLLVAFEDSSFVTSISIVERS